MDGFQHHVRIDHAFGDMKRKARLIPGKVAIFTLDRDAINIKAVSTSAVAACGGGPQNVVRIHILRCDDELAFSAVRAL